MRQYSDRELLNLQRVGVVDVGSNSVRLVVFDGAARSPAYFYNEKILCGLGLGLAETGKLHPEGRARALAALKRFAVLAAGMDLQSLTAVGTAAVREASDGAEFCAEVARETGISIEIAPGLEEARLSAQGVLLGWPEAEGLVCDIGGASMELAILENGAVGGRETSPLGPLKLRDIAGNERDLKTHIQSELSALRDKIQGDHSRLYLVGGSFRAIARLDMARTGYPLKVLHEYRITPQNMRKTLKWISRLQQHEMQMLTETSAERLALVPLAGRVLRSLIKVFEPEEIAISSYGIREGLLYEQMPEDVRRRDPLIEACLQTESAAARFPGFGGVLFDWLRPLYQDVPAQRLRLIHAACLLHDVSWRAHPDYRSEVCFDNVTRANLGGLDHEGRIFLGLALLNRYSPTGTGPQFERLGALLSEAQVAEAEALGRAMRLGAMLSGAAVEHMGRLSLTEDTLTLHLGAAGTILFGEVALKRFEAVAKSLDLEHRVEISGA